MSVYPGALRFIKIKNIKEKHYIIKYNNYVLIHIKNDTTVVQARQTRKTQEDMIQ